MKIVINSCYGGFKLSAAAVRRLCEIEGIPCFFMKDMSHDYKNRDWQEVPKEQENSLFCWPFKTNDGQLIKENYDLYQIDTQRDVDRNSPTLLQVIEELGTEACSGKCAELKVVEIPDDVEWEIEEYDGAEWISEKHRTWR